MPDSFISPFIVPRGQRRRRVVRKKIFPEATSQAATATAPAGSTSAAPTASTATAFGSAASSCAIA